MIIDNRSIFRDDDIRDIILTIATIQPGRLRPIPLSLYVVHRKHQVTWKVQISIHSSRWKIYLNERCTARELAERIYMEFYAFRADATYATRVRARRARDLARLEQEPGQLQLRRKPLNQTGETDEPEEKDTT